MDIYKGFLTKLFKKILVLIIVVFSYLYVPFFLFTVATMLTIYTICKYIYIIRKDNLVECKVVGLESKGSLRYGRQHYAYVKREGIDKVDKISFKTRRGAVKFYNNKENLLYFYAGKKRDSIIPKCKVLSDILFLTFIIIPLLIIIMVITFSYSVGNIEKLFY
ncbi:hypothetical protein [Miniphocaeibacter massiliensis]|uniref:hypothetical protein n=1 Tax=Miniphocaeibacter massiliensis TaxID=2041841 RepID=UPI000C1BD5C5|nr:hypothetical protein [Miniphocaeibacter massiliensis]